MLSWKGFILQFFTTASKYVSTFRSSASSLLIFRTRSYLERSLYCNKIYLRVVHIPSAGAIKISLFHVQREAVKYLELEVKPLIVSAHYLSSHKAAGGKGGQWV